MKSFTTTDGAKLSYWDTGAGMPVVFLHPTPLDHDYWRPMVEDLAGVRAIVPDLRGHGGSELGQNLPVGGFARVPDAPVLTLEQLADDILALLDHLEVRRRFLLAARLAGYTLLELWRKAPGADEGIGVCFFKASAGCGGQSGQAGCQYCAGSSGG
jgi:3-oxoadipate enol-lactonase